jgi:hypothetical protein
MSPIIERTNPSGGTVYGIRWTDVNRPGFPGGSESRIPILLEGKTGSWRIASTRMS